MRATQFGRILLGLGVVVGVTATAAWVLGFDPATLPPALLKIAAYKLTALATVGLIGAGAVVTRFGRLAELDQARLSSYRNDASALGEGDVSTEQDRRVGETLRERRQ